MATKYFRRLVLFLVMIVVPSIMFAKNNTIEFSGNSILDFEVEFSISPQNIQEAIEFKGWEKQSNVFNFGFLRKPIWFKIHIKNSLNTPQSFIIRYPEGFVEKIDFYIKRDTSNRYDTTIDNKANEDLLEYISNGTRIDYLKRKTNFDTFPTVSVNIEPDEELVVYVEFFSGSSSFGRLEILSQLDYMKSFRNYTMMYAFYFGLLLIVLFYNIVMGTLSPDKKIYLYYAAYVLFLFLWGLFRSGYYRYIFNDAAIPILSASVSLVFIFSILFTMRLFEVQMQKALYVKILRFFIVLLVATAIITLFDFFYGLYILVYLGIFIIMVFVVLFVVLAVKNKDKFIYAYVTLYLPFLISVALYAMVFAGILYPSFLIRYAYIFASMIEVGGFSFLLVYKMKLLYKEKMDEASRILDLQDSYAKDLELKVQEQTMGLQIVNEKLMLNLKERELLIQEVYHRVKNNFQFIISLLWMQNKKTNSVVLKKTLTEVANRIKSIAITHELLYASDDLSHISSQEYFVKLMFALKNTAKDKDIIIRWRICDKMLDLQKALHLGIIISEVFSNAIKHNHTTKTKKVTVFFFCREDNRVILLVKDNGEGFDSEDEKNLNSFGLALVTQLSSSFPSSRHGYFYKKGTVFYLEFEA